MKKKHPSNTKIVQKASVYGSEETDSSANFNSKETQEMGLAWPQLHTHAGKLKVGKNLVILFCAKRDERAGLSILGSGWNNKILCPIWPQTQHYMHLRALHTFPPMKLHPCVFSRAVQTSAGIASLMHFLQQPVGSVSPLLTPFHRLPSTRLSLQSLGAEPLK